MKSETLFALMFATSLALAWTLARNKRLKVIAVIDGDTFEAVSERGRKYRLRLRGCDCPERDQPHGAEATAFARSLLLNKWVNVRLYGRDRYRRHLARVSVEGKDACQALLAAGLAFPLNGKFSGAAVLARFNRRGVWASGFRTRPWEARSRRRGALPWLLRRSARAFKRWGSRS